MTTELNPMEQALKEIPQSWYENPNVMRFAERTAFLATTGFLYSSFSAGSYSWRYHLISASLFLASAVADRITTSFALTVVNRARQSGVPNVAEEANPILQNVRTAKDFIFHRRFALIELGGIAASAAIPSVGVGVSIGKFLASINNIRVTRRHNRAVEIARSNTENSPIV